MFDQELSKISIALEDFLSKIKSSKNKAVHLQKYECSAKLREIEKQVKVMADSLDNYLAAHHALTAKGKQYYNELFNYCIINNWENVPDKFIALFLERKIKLNQQIEFDNKNCDFLLKLNEKFAQEENIIREFYGYVKFVISIKECNQCLDDLNTVKLTIKFYTETDHYKVISCDFDFKHPFYKFKISLGDVINTSPVMFDETRPDYDLFKNLPVQFIEKGFCPLFALIVTGGSLAWQDLLNISQVSIHLHVNHQFPSFNLTT